jgi:predicted membrane-bound spermidine synthase
MSAVLTVADDPNERLLELAWQHEMTVLVNSTPRIQVELSPLTSWLLLSTIQLALRHPNFPETTRQYVEPFARELQQRVAPSGALAIVAERGWNPDFDVDP